MRMCPGRGGSVPVARRHCGSGVARRHCEGDAVNMWRVASVGATFVMTLLAFTYLPTWRECLVFALAGVVCNACHIRLGQLMYEADK